MRSIHTLVWHCTASREDRAMSMADVRRFHMTVNKWKAEGYHLLVRRDGSVELGRPESQVGAHVAGHNVGTLGYAYEGGLDVNGRAKDTRTAAQKATMLRLTVDAISRHRLRKVTGHRDLSPDLNADGIISPNEWTKQCPCFDAGAEYMPLIKRAA